MIEVARRGIRRFAQIEEVAGAQEGLVAGEHRLRERAPLFESLENELFEPEQCFFRYRLASSDLYEAPKQAPRVFLRIGGLNVRSKIIKQDAM